MEAYAKGLEGRPRPAEVLGDARPSMSAGYRATQQSRAAKLSDGCGCFPLHTRPEANFTLALGGLRKFWPWTLPRPIS
jgi:hypothetical protein